MPRSVLHGLPPSVMGVPCLGSQAVHMPPALAAAGQSGLCLQAGGMCADRDLAEGRWVGNGMDGMQWPLEVGTGAGV